MRKVELHFKVMKISVGMARIPFCGGEEKRKLQLIVIHNSPHEMSRIFHGSSSKSFNTTTIISGTHF